MPEIRLDLEEGDICAAYGDADRFRIRRDRQVRH